MNKIDSLFEKQESGDHDYSSSEFPRCTWALLLARAKGCLKVKGSRNMSWYTGDGFLYPVHMRWFAGGREQPAVSTSPSDEHVFLPGPKFIQAAIQIIKSTVASE